MKITVKTTQQKVYQVDVEGSDSIGSLKSKIEQEHGHPVTAQKIIYSGKILSDDKTVESCGIKEKDFLVLMVSKPKPPPVPLATAELPSAEPSTSTPAPPAVPAPAPAPVETPVAPTPPPPAASTPAPEPTAEPVQGQSSAPLGSSFLSGADFQNAVNGLCEMGFEREHVQRAMRASFNNPDRAVEYLMNGIPTHLEAEASGQAQTQAVAAGGAAGTQQPPPVAPAGQAQNLFQLAQEHQQQTGGAAGGNAQLPGGLNIEAIRNSPQIQQLREELQRNPEGAQVLLQQLAAQNPGIAQMVSQNPDMLYQLLGVEADELGEGAIPEGAHVVSLTQPEVEAVQRLESLGFNRQEALQAYLLCDKNEDLAANYLFDTQSDDM